ncbi:MAG: TetR/AcrR family transcriptional regulator [Reyranella sp.]|jgi:AcrR family transcriptional regulator|nr:MAG: TetR/AcrR family transcriptional regulator [Reyranella sp.]
MSRSKTRAYHHGDLREALVASGRKLLEEKGVRGFTLRECARRADVSHAAPAHHFASMDELLAELVRRGFEELVAAMAAEAGRAGAEPAARLVGLGVGYMAFAAANSVLFQLMYSQEAVRLEAKAADGAAEAVRSLLADEVEEALGHASGEVRQRMTDFAWATMHGFITLVLEGGIGGRDSSRALKTRGLAALAAMAETVVRSGSPR